ncbi:MAG TPA: acyl carrier protein [Anaerolineaceae bacterium]|nr:acyl carrier protein [Anaerolineaceae bacterium]HQH86478.1 acyl carrier protein [Anaerolineaceae bacterium]
MDFPLEAKMDDIFELVKAVIVDVLKVDGSEITSETRFIEDLKADSMDQFFLIDGFCEKFGINIGDEDARAIRSVADVLTYLEAHRSELKIKG